MCRCLCLCGGAAVCLPWPSLTRCLCLCVCRQLIYNYPEQLFADAGVMAIEHADFDGIERLALVTGGEIVSTFDQPQLVKLGSCRLIEEVSRCPRAPYTHPAYSTAPGLDLPAA